MTKSCLGTLQGLYRCILLDISGTNALTRGSARDLERILSLSSSRGTSFFTIELPAVGKALDRALSDGHLSPICIAGFRPYKTGSRIPRLFKELWMQVFEDDGCLKEDADIVAISHLRQLLNGAKKVRITCDDSRRRKAIREVFRHEESIRRPSLLWVGDGLDGFDPSGLHLNDVGPKDEPEQRSFISFEPTADLPQDLWEHVQFSCDVLSTSLGDFCPDDWKFKHGPGAVADASGPTDKYRFPSWSARLEEVFPYARFGFPNYSAWVDRLTDKEESSDSDSPCRLLTVPKDQKKPRVIACEPVAYQWCQQAIWQFIRDKLQRTYLRGAIRFNDQSQNQGLALVSSLTGKFATIDLSMASDSVSLWLVERAFRRNTSLLRALRASRSGWLKYESPVTKTVSYMAMKKFAAMGAATTFPIQSVLYGMIAVGVLSYLSGSRPSAALLRELGQQVSVFGDDIVIPTTASERFIETLTSLGFLVNQRKTFTKGNFRESCGVEAFKGEDVSSAYWLEAYDEARPSSMKSVVEQSNNFFRKGYWRSAAYIESTLPHWVRKNLRQVSIDDGSFGLVSFLGGRTSHLKSRWSPTLHRKEVRVAESIDKAIRTPTNGYSPLFQYFTEAPSQMTNWSSGITSRLKSYLTLKWVPA